jgi:hypothetical protein
MTDKKEELMNKRKEEGLKNLKRFPAFLPPPPGISDYDL